MQGIQVPQEVIDYIDFGRNPQLFTQDCKEKARTKEKEVDSVIEAYCKFDICLMAKLTSEFPEEIDCYRALKGYGSGYDFKVQNYYEKLNKKQIEDKRQAKEHQELIEKWLQNKIDTNELCKIA